MQVCIVSNCYLLYFYIDSINILVLVVLVLVVVVLVLVVIVYYIILDRWHDVDCNNIRSLPMLLN